MEYFRNKTESFYREIRQVEIYKASEVSFLDNFLKTFPASNNALYIFEVVPESFNQKIQTKTRDGNYFYDISIDFPLLDMSEENIEKCQEYFNKRGFCTVMAANTEKMLLGNKEEPFRVEFLDGRKNDGSGNDECTIVISGESIISPKSKDF